MREEKNVQNIKTKEVLVYVTMPRVIPRLKSLFVSGFGYISFLLAHVYSMARLLPYNHPYLMPENIGRYGIRHVIGEVSRNLVFSRKNIDQILIYFVTLAGIFMLLAQFIMMIYAMVIAPAMAFSWFNTYLPRDDIAFNLLDQIFGIPGIYCNSLALPSATYAGITISAALPISCTEFMEVNGIASLSAGPLSIGNLLPYHEALHDLFRFYSVGLLLIAVIIFLYFLVVIVIETAVSGTPFGQRFQNVWVPVRLVVALGLLMPINYGLNSGQYVVLYAAKWGSGLATNGWVQFNATIVSQSIFSGAGGANPMGERYSLLAFPEIPDITSTIEAMSLVHSCAYAYHRINAGQFNKTRGTGTYPEITANYTAGTEGDFQIQPYLIKQPSSGMPAGPIGGSQIVGDPAERLFISTPTSVTYLRALGFYYANDIIIRFGEFRRELGSVTSKVYTSEIAGVKPLCGDIRIPVMDVSDAGGALASPSRGGSDAMLKHYYELVMALWFEDVRMRQFARLSVEHSISKDRIVAENFCSGTETGGAGGGPLSGRGTGFAGFPSTLAECLNNGPSEDWKAGRGTNQGMIDRYTDLLRADMIQAWIDYVQNSTYTNISFDVMSRGWGGAGIWYNKLAEINGGWMSGVRAIPAMDAYPIVMEQVRDYKRQNNEAIEGLRQFDPTLKAAAEGSPPKKVIIAQGGDELEKVAEPLASVYSYWNPETGPKNPNDLSRVPVSNVFVNAIHLMLGTNGLTNIRGANQHLHPLAQLVAVGKGLVDSAVFNMAASSVSTFLGGMVGAMAKYKDFAGAAEAASQIFYAMAFIGLTAGFVLFYVLPFLPFLYFYFAVASWVKAIFEAMVGVPLWALAHMRIDGEGLPGDAAQNGYFLIMEIFIRPILTVFGLIAAIIIFSTQVRILNLIWDLVTTNASGFAPTLDIVGVTAVTDPLFQRSVIDQFFFTIIYTIICYMLALSSFKLIDKIPDNILRWAGAGVSSFGDIDQDQVENISRYVSTGGMTVGNQAAGAVRDAAGGLGGAIGKQVASPPQAGGP